MPKSSDIKSVLHTAAASPKGPPDVEGALRRAPVLRRRRRVLSATLACIVAGAGLWVSASAWSLFQDDEGRTSPIQKPPETPNITPARVDTIKLEGAPTEIVIGGDSVWVVNSGGSDGRLITRIDPTSGEILSEIAPSDFVEEYVSLDIDYSADRLWVVTTRTNNSAGDILQFDSQGQLIDAPNNLSFAPGDLSADESGVWVTDSKGGLVHIDENGTQTSVSVEAERVVTGYGDLWAALPVEGTIWNIDRDSKEVLDEIDVGPNPVGLEVDDSYLWALLQTPEGEMRLTRIDRVTHIQGNSLSLEMGSGSLAVGHGVVWVPLNGQSLENGPGKVIAVSPETNTILGEPIGVGSGPTDIAADSQAVWVTNFNDNTLSKITFEE